jgi:hypothetical protein
MTFDDITGNGHLWAVRNDGEEDNELYKLFDKWNDVVWLRTFFKANFKDLLFFGVDVNTAISDTIEDSDTLETIVFDMSGKNLNTIFHPLSNYRQEIYLAKEKAKINRHQHTSWLRIYAIKLSQDVFIITGGAIKLTATMQEREHTAQELVKIERTRRFLIDNGIIDEYGFEDYLREL